MNTELLRQIKTHILEEPKRLAMGTWIQEKKDNLLVRESYHGTPDGNGDFNYSGTSHEFPRCGTAACIGGWARVLHLRDNPRATVIGFGEILNLTGSQEWKLFYVSHWDEPFRTQYMAADTPEARAKIAGEYIDHFIVKHQGAL